MQGQPPISFLLPKYSMFLNANISNMLKNYLKFRISYVNQRHSNKTQTFLSLEYKAPIII